MGWGGRTAHPTGSPSRALPRLSLSCPGTGVAVNPSSGHSKRADLGSHPAVPARALWHSDMSLSLYPTPELSQPGAHFHCPPNLLDLGLAPPDGTPESAPSPGPALGGQGAAGRHSWDLGSCEPALRGGTEWVAGHLSWCWGHSRLVSPAQSAPSSPLSP